MVFVDCSGVVKPCSLADFHLVIRNFLEFNSKRFVCLKTSIVECQHFADSTDGLLRRAAKATDQFIWFKPFKLAYCLDFQKRKCLLC